jgi:transcription-repair coupling factor (superfamily II helicase)
LGIETLEIKGIHKDYLKFTAAQFIKLRFFSFRADVLLHLVDLFYRDVQLIAKVENSVQDIADDLIKLYAEREASKGYAFSPDHEMQSFGSFPSEPTYFCTWSICSTGTYSLSLP